MINCPLCNSTHTGSSLTAADYNTYYLCCNCNLIFTDEKLLPDTETEKARYLTHQNGIEYPGYVMFLNRAIKPALPYFKTGFAGLDFGCGPTPTLSLLIEKNGFKCNNYDPLFFPEINKNNKYNFIFATECFEHFFKPAREMNLINSILQPQGLLIIMTELWHTPEHFRSWYYVKDPTHVSFFHQQTISYICKSYNFDLLFSDEKRVFILQKK